MNPKEVINISYAKLGDGGILGVANFVGSPRYDDFVKLPGDYNRRKFNNGIYIPEKNIYIPRMQEVLNKKGHLLAGCLPEPLVISDDTELEEIIKIAEDNNAFCIVDHPFMFMGQDLF